MRTKYNNAATQRFSPITRKLLAADTRPVLSPRAENILDNQGNFIKSLLLDLPHGYYDRDRTEALPTPNCLTRCLSVFRRARPAEPFTVMLQTTAQDGLGDYSYVKKMMAILAQIPNVRVKLCIGVLGNLPPDEPFRKKCDDVAAFLGVPRADIQFHEYEAGFMGPPVSMAAYSSPPMPIDVFMSVSSFVDLLDFGSQERCSSQGFVQLKHTETPVVYWGEIGNTLGMPGEFKATSREFGLSGQEGIGTLITPLSTEALTTGITHLRQSHPQLLKALLPIDCPTPETPDAIITALKGGFELGYHSHVTTANDFIRFSVATQEPDAPLRPILINKPVDKILEADEDFQKFLYNHHVEAICYGPPGNLQTLNLVESPSPHRTLRLIESSHIPHDDFMALKSLAATHGIRGDHSLYEAISLKRPFFFEGYRYADNFKFKTFTDMAACCPEGRPLHNYFTMLVELYPSRRSQNLPKGPERHELIKRITDIYLAIRPEEWSAFFEQMHQLSVDATIKQMVQLLQADTQAPLSRSIQRCDQLMGHEFPNYARLVPYLETLEGSIRELCIARTIKQSSRYQLDASTKSQLLTLGRSLTDPFLSQKIRPILQRYEPAPQRWGAGSIPTAHYDLKATGPTQTDLTIKDHHESTV